MLPPPDSRVSTRPGDRVTIVVPCFNEARRLRLEAFRSFSERHPGVCFLFVNDGSTDDTGPVLENFCRQNPGQWACLGLERNSGKAEAVRQGVLTALREPLAAVGYWDADLSTPLDEIPPMLAALDEFPLVELVMGARVRLMGRDIHRLALRHYAGRVFATAASLTLGIAVYDTQCGAKLFRVTPRLAALFEAPFLSRWIFDVELIARRLEALSGPERAAADTFIIEYPLRAWADVAGSKVTARDAARAAGELLRIAARYR